LKINNPAPPTTTPFFFNLQTLLLQVISNSQITEICGRLYPRSKGFSVCKKMITTTEVIKQIYHLFTNLRKKNQLTTNERLSSATYRTLCPEVHPDTHKKFSVGSLEFAQKGPLNHRKMGTNSQTPDISKPACD